MRLLFFLLLTINLCANGLVDATKQYLQDYDKATFENKITQQANLDPQKFHLNYLELYKDPNYSKYAQVFKEKYNRFTESVIVRAYAAHDLLIDEKILDYVVSHAFFSSALANAEYSKNLIELFKIYFNYSEKNNIKRNQEIHTILYSNYLISQNQIEEAYKILKEQAPYSISAIRIIKSYSNIKHIPLYRDRAKLLEAIGSDRLKLKEATLEYKGDNVIF